jgi:O-antigen ligase
VGLLGQLQLLPSALSTRLASIAGSLSLFDPRTVLVTPANFAVVERMAQVWAGWQMFVTHPLVGVGPGAYTAAYQQYALPPWFASRGHAHNYYLHMAAEAGVIGLLAYVGLLVAVVADLRVAFVRVTGLHQRAILVGICGMIAAMVGHNLFENLHVLHLSVHMAAAWGLAIALVHTPEGT